MKLWKCAAIALTLCGAALSVLRTRMAPARTGHLLSRDSSSPRSPSPTTFNASVSLDSEQRRRRRSTEGANSVLSEVMDMFQSFTEGELKQVIGALVERKARRDASESKRTKRARKGTRCSLQNREVTVSQLELGYESDEIVLFSYCSGKCSASRRNYDITLASMKERLRHRREKVRHNPCCRPTSYEEDFAFLDNHNKYQTIKEWSASKCGCV
ncbi:neurturin [Alosa alosa]|uniref:neurturin n=1 Tax=Alosa sapidissima TaxID=34773 RepID=UPI001C07FCB4|nr:neurturin [Alosa sapidissima]XP_041912755.1 neurturin [Alosa sapidissima]XP_048109322.1 neurturin [Alosa alosa]